MSYNNTYSEYLRYKGQQLFNPLISAGYRVYFLNYYLNSQDMRNSAAIYNSASRYISSISSNNQMVAAGVSMGGVIVRYALTKAENDGAPLPFKKFISIDGPQQGAITSRSFQDYIKGNDPTDFQKHGLDNDAAKELLIYDTYGNLHSSFFSELNSLNNGKGYPKLIQNIGVSFSNGSPNPGSGTWLTINFESIYLISKSQSFSLSDEDKVSGSYLPRSLVARNSFPYNVYWVVAGMLEIDRDPVNNPTFIPYTSSLDLVNGISKFDTVIQSTSNHFHDEFPSEIVIPLLSKFISISPTILISGSASLKVNQNGSYTANASGGFPPYRYQWYKMEVGNSAAIATASSVKPNLYPVNVWMAVGSNGTTINLSDVQNFDVKCVVTDANNTSVTSNIIYVSVGSFSASTVASNFSLSEATQKDIVNDENTPANISINQNYPNPFNPTTTINYQLPVNARITLKVFDVLGREVATLVDGMKEAGSYTATFDGSHFASGMYFAKMVVNPANGSKPFVQVKKMLMLK